MSDDTFSASDFSSAETSLSSDPAPASDPAPVEASAPVETAAQPGEATTQPAVAETETPPSTTPAPTAGPIPFDVHKTALENARTKAVAEWEQQYGWAKAVNPQDFQRAVTLAQRIGGADPIQGLQEIIAEIRQNPQHDAAIRSLAARALAQRSQAAEPEEPQPDLPIQLDNGQVVHLYSAQQQAKREAFLQQRLLAQINQELEPVRSQQKALQDERDAVQRQHAIEHFTTTTFADVQTWPGMDTADARAAVAKELAQARIDPNDPREVALALNAAYRKAIIPTLHTASRQAVLNDINRQAAASTVNPAQTSTRAPKSMDEMSIVEALQHVAAQQR